MTSLNATELTLIAFELRRELLGGVIQKVFTPSARRVVLEIRKPGESVFLHLCVESDAVRMGVLEQRAPNPQNPPGWQSVLRRELTSSRLTQIDLHGDGTVVAFTLTRGDTVRILVFDSVKPAIALLHQTGVALTHTPLKDGRATVGKDWPLAPVDDPSPLIDYRLNRLAGESTRFRLTRAAEAQGHRDQEQQADRAHAATQAAQLKKLDRTIEKVRQEAQRGALAERYRREAEALTHGLHLIKKGARMATVPEYLADGTVGELTIDLDPSKSAKDNVAFRFHQYRRFTRGVVLSRERLLLLEQQRSQLLLATPAELPEKPLEPPSRTSRQASENPQPYRQYRTRSGERIWVGRGAANNDQLTFHHARPFHYWFHARGVPGAHVVALVEKNGVLTEELLLDAAHLAAFHSDAKSEAKVEVSYTQVKYVVKVKGAAPGAVRYTREKTILLRFDSERLRRLAADVNRS